jgi:hypothetical protein
MLSVHGTVYTELCNEFRVYYRSIVKPSELLQSDAHFIGQSRGCKRSSRQNWNVKMDDQKTELRKNPESKATFISKILFW